ncbi:glycosyl hydrolase family 65 protein, partial [Streptomyces pharetrae]|uniref:glycosyl hydrolase family 65 protein n=1 Tax=Streptomyces pharetrae TaxID=291370 RepID=UPI0036AC79B7
DVTGPDEYSAVADDNAYTNLMARQNLLDAAEAVRRHPEEAERLGVGEEESAAWRAAAEAMYVPYNAELGVHEQHAGFTRYQRWDFAATRPDQYPLLLNFPYFDLYRKQVVKQADLVLAMYTCGSRFDEEQIARNFAYYEPLTVRDSSLSACCQAVIAAQAGHLRLAYDYTAEAALMDLADLEHNTRDGLHIASLAGTWMALVAGFGGMRRDGDTLRFAPRLPEQFSRLAFSLQILGRRLRVEITPEKATYTLLSGPPLTIGHHGEPLTVSADGPAVRMVPATPDRPAPRQPPHRRPNAR